MVMVKLEKSKLLSSLKCAQFRSILWAQLKLDIWIFEFL